MKGRNPARDGGGDLSLDELVDRFGERLLERVRFMMGARARACAESGDFVQGAFAAILKEDRYAFRDEQHFLRLAVRIARNDIQDEVKRKRERAFSALSDSVVINHGDQDAVTPSKVLGEQERSELLAQALEQLDPQYRRVIELRSLDGRSFASIGVELQRSEKAAHLLHTRAITRLGAVLRRSAL